MIKILIKILILNLISNTVIFSQTTKYIPFNKLNYPSDYYYRNDAVINFDNIKIEIIRIEVKDEYIYNSEISNAVYGPSYWIFIKEGQKFLGKICYYDINSLGGHGDLFIPNKQPLKNYYIISKLGDYDGRTLLIKNTGEYFDLPGGYFYIDNNKNLLINIHQMDACYDFSLYDYTNNKFIYKSDINKIFIDDMQFYYKQNSYYFWIAQKSNDESFIKFNINNFKTDSIKIQKKDLSLYKKINTDNMHYLISKIQ